MQPACPFKTAVQLSPFTCAGALVLQASAHLKATAGLYDPLCSLFAIPGRTKLESLSHEWLLCFQKLLDALAEQYGLMFSIGRSLECSSMQVYFLHVHLE